MSVLGLSRQVQRRKSANQTFSVVRNTAVTVATITGHGNGHNEGWGCSSVGRASDRHTADAGSIPGATRDFSPRVDFQCRLSHGVRTPPCATACINICANVKDPVIHVRVRWIMETLKHAAHCRLVARLCRSWLSPGRATQIFNGRNPSG